MKPDKKVLWLLTAFAILTTTAGIGYSLIYSSKPVVYLSMSVLFLTLCASMLYISIKGFFVKEMSKSYSKLYFGHSIVLVGLMDLSLAIQALFFKHQNAFDYGLIVAGLYFVIFGIKRLHGDKL